MKKFLVGLLSVCMAFTAIGCGGGGDTTGGGGGGGSSFEGKYNNKTNLSTKTTLKVAAMAAGLGSYWLQEAAEEFARLNQDTSFADGKKGVYVELNQPTTGIAAVFAGIANSGEDIVFTEQGSQVSTYIHANRFYPVTEVVKDASRVGGTLESKMFDKHKEVFMKGEDYYAIPHAEFYGGLGYNHDVFLQNNALIADASCEDDFKVSYEGKYNEGNPVYFAVSEDIGTEGCVLSPGPDGEKGTDDDGLPCSIEEFVVMMDYFKQEKEIFPIVLSGQYQNMVNYFICGMWASLAGQAQMESYYSLNGEIEVVTGFSDENLIPNIDYVKKPFTKKVPMTKDDANLGNSMVAKYYAIALAEIIQKEEFYLGELQGNTTNTNHLAAQAILINSSDDAAAGALGTSKTAMLMDGSYWINETTDAGNFDNFEMFAAETTKSDVRHMALPTSITTAEAEEKIAKETNAPSTLMDINYGCAVVNAKIADKPEQKAAAMAFLKFFYSEEQMKAYTRSSRQFLALSYDFSEEELTELNPFYQKLWKLRDNKKGSNIVYPSPRVGTDASTMAVYRKAIGTIYTYLQSPNLAPTAPGSGATSPYPVFDLTKNVLDGEIYCYGSQFVFNNLKITDDDWFGFTNVAI